MEERVEWDNKDTNKGRLYTKIGSILCLFSYIITKRTI